MPTGKPIEADWESIKLAVCGGMEQKEACSVFGIPLNALKKRASREEWPTAKIVKKRASRLISERREMVRANSESPKKSQVESPKSLTSILAESWAEKAESHRKLAFDIAHNALKRAPESAKVPVDWSDIDRADKMARRAAGLESEGNTQVNVGLTLVNQRLEASGSPKDAIDI
jgi:hypothetical protein